jgi:hypothetical protein
MSGGGFNICMMCNKARIPDFRVLCLLCQIPQPDRQLGDWAKGRARERENAKAQEGTEEHTGGMPNVQAVEAPGSEDEATQG